MTAILVDHDIEGQALLIWGAIAAGGWLTLLPMQLVRFADVGLPPNTSDREVWRFAQARTMLLLTGNRNMREEDSLEQTIREERTGASLPVLTVGRPDRLKQRAYREACARRIVEIVLDLDDYRGVGRIFVP